MFKKGLIIICSALVANVVLLSCSKRLKRQHCTTVLTGIATTNVVLHSGSIYGTPVYTNGIDNEPVHYDNFAVQVTAIDSSIKCEEMAALFNPNFMINSCYAFDPVVSAHTTDRIANFEVIAASTVGTALEGDTITDQFMYNTYLLEHRHENLGKADLIAGFNTLLSEAGKGNFFAGDYLPKLYIKMKDNSMCGLPIRFKFVVTLTSGIQLSSISDEIVVLP
jgi:hypothetical protein